MTSTTERLRDLIADCGQSQGDFAEAVGLDPSKLSKTLAGTRRLSSLDLARIADHTGVTVDWLLSGQESPVALAARRVAGSPTAQAVEHAHRLIELRSSAVRLGYPRPWHEVAYDGLRGLAYEQGTALAHSALRRVVEAGRSSVVVDLAALLEEVFGVDVCLTELGAGVDGLAASSGDARVILASLTPVPYRQRFTLAHELGHLLAGDDQGLHVDEDIFGAASKRGLGEMRASAFAAAFLMPEGELRDSVGAGFDRDSFARLAMRLHVSPGALSYRLTSLRLLDEMAATELRSMSAKEAARRAGRASQLAEATTYSGTARVPAALAADLLAAYVDGRATLRPYAALMQVDTDTLRAELERDDQES